MFVIPRSVATTNVGAKHALTQDHVGPDALVRAAERSSATSFDKRKPSAPMLAIPKSPPRPISSSRQLPQLLHQLQPPLNLLPARPKRRIKEHLLRANALTGHHVFLDLLHRPRENHAVFAQRLLAELQV